MPSDLNLLGSACLLFYFKFLFFKLNLLQYCFCFYVLFFGPQGTWDLSILDQGSTPHPSLEGEVLTTGSQETPSFTDFLSLSFSFLCVSLIHTHTLLKFTTLASSLPSSQATICARMVLAQIFFKRERQERRNNREGEGHRCTPWLSSPDSAVSNPRPQNSSLTLIQWDSYFILLK